MTSARRSRDRRWLWTLTAVAAVVLASLVVVRFRTGSETPPTPPRQARVVLLPTANPTPPPSPTATPTPEPVFVELESELELPPPPSPTETPWVIAPTIPATPRPRASERRPQRLADCLSVTWTYGQASLRPPQVLIDIAARNGCGRDLAPSEVWFRVTGWRDGDLIQTATGHLFTPLYAGSVGYTGIGLPGSQTWYDRITLEVLEGAP